jgi:hypothetical protein
MPKTTTMKKITAVSAALLFSLVLQAQTDLTIHNMQSIPQRGFSNPAMIPDSRFHFGIPGASSVNLNFRNSLSLNDVFERTPDDSLLIDLPNIADRLGEGNFTNLDIQEELLFFGFRIGKNYLSVGSRLTSSLNLGLPPDLLSFLVEGNAAFLGETAEIGGLNLNYNLYLENSVSYARQITDALRVGVRGKYLMGLATIRTREMSIGLYTDPDDYSITATSKILVDMSFPSDFIDSIPLGSLENFNGPDFDNFDPLDLLSEKFNGGFAFDIGANYKLSERWSFNASVLDIGSISWNRNVRNLKSDEASFTFTGLDLYQIFSDSTTDVGDQMDVVLDSLTGIFNFNVTETSFSNSLVPKIYVGATYSLTPGTIFGALVRADYFDKQIYPSLTLSATKKLTRFLTLSASYTARQNSYANFGVGMALNMGPVQFYLLSDNASNFLYYGDTRGAHVHFGLNVLVGRKTKQNKPILDL